MGVTVLVTCLVMLGLCVATDATSALLGPGKTNFNSLLFFFFFLIVYFTSYFVFSIAVLPHSSGVVNYHILLRWETRIPGVAPFSF